MSTGYGIGIPFRAGAAIVPPDIDQLVQWLYTNDGETATDKIGTLDEPTVTNANSLSFNGSSTYIDSGLYYDGSSDIDYTVKFNATNLAANRLLISDRGTYRNYQLLVLTTGVFRIQVVTSTGYQAHDFSTFTAGVDTVVRVFIDVSTGECTPYVNGVAQTGTTFTGTFTPSSSTIAVGRENVPPGSNYFLGTIYEVEVKNHFHYTLEGGAGSIAYDIESRGTVAFTDSKRVTLHPYPEDTDRDVVHPDVWVFSSPWNGYTHWMVYTPYPSAATAFENPSIEASNDGILWETPAGVTNPLVPQPAGFNSDPELIYDDDKLKIIYRESITATQIENLRIIESSDGVTWSSPSTIVSKHVTAERLLSPTVSHNGTEWVMITWDVISSNWKYRTSSSLDSGWSDSSACTLTNVTTNPWHQKMRYVDNEYVMFCQTGTSSGGDLILIKSSDGINWDFSTAITLKTTVGGSAMYRSTFWPDMRDGVRTYNTWLGTIGLAFYNARYDNLGNNGTIYNGTWSIADYISSHLKDGFAFGGIESATANNYIDLGAETIIGASDYRVDLIFIGNSSGSAWCGIGTTNERAMIYKAGSAINSYLDDVNAVVQDANSGYAAGEITNVITERRNDELYVSCNNIAGTTISVTGKAASLTDHFFMFAASNGAASIFPSTCEILSMKLWIDDVLTRDMVPVAGGKMLDKVNSVTYENDGAGTLVTRYTPSLDDSSGAADGSELYGVGGKVHNRAEADWVQGDVAWVGAIGTLSIANADAHINGTDGQWLKWEAPGVVAQAIKYDAAYVLTAAAYDRLLRWSNNALGYGNGVIASP